MLALLKNTTISIYGFLAYFLIGCQKLMQIRSNRKFPRFVEDGGQSRRNNSDPFFGFGKSGNNALIGMFH